jgi:hypothetical protein
MGVTNKRGAAAAGAENKNSRAVDFLSLSAIKKSIIMENLVLMHAYIIFGNVNWNIIYMIIIYIMSM